MKSAGMPSLSQVKIILAVLVALPSCSLVGRHELGMDADRIRVADTAEEMRDILAPLDRDPMNERAVSSVWMAVVGLRGRTRAMWLSEMSARRRDLPLTSQGAMALSRVASEFLEDYAEEASSWYPPTGPAKQSVAQGYFEAKAYVFALTIAFEHPRKMTGGFERTVAHVLTLCQGKVDAEGSMVEAWSAFYLAARGHHIPEAIVNRIAQRHGKDWRLEGPICVLRRASSRAERGQP